MVQCEKCNKNMTKNTLRYHHDKNCPGKPIDKNLPVKCRIKKEESKSKNIVKRGSNREYNNYLNETSMSRNETIYRKHFRMDKNHSSLP